MADEESSARFIGGVQPRAAAWRGFPHHGRRLGDPGLRHVLGDREEQRPVARPPGPVATRRLAGHRGGLGLWRGTPGARAMRSKAPVPAIDWAFDQLGWTDMIHCIDPAKRALAGVGAAAGLAPARPRQIAARHSRSYRWRSGVRRATNGGVAAHEPRIARAVSHTWPRSCRSCMCIALDPGA